MLTLAPTLILTAVAAALAVLVNRRIESILPASMCLSALCLYVFALCGILRIGFYFVVGLGCASALFLVAYCVFRGRRRITTLLFTPGFFAFLFCMALSYLISRGRVLADIDEFSHWGLLLKNMYLWDALGNAPLSTVIYKSYPPAASLMEYFFVRFSAAFSEKALFRGIHVLMFSMLCPAFARMEWKDWKRALILLGILLSFPLLFYRNAYSTIYVDVLMGLMFGQLLLSALVLPDENPAIRTASFFLVASALALTKPAGIGFVLIACLIIAFCRWKREGKALFLRGGEQRIPQAAWMAICLLGIVIVRASWSGYLAFQGVDDGMWIKPCSFSFEKLAKLLGGGGTDYEKTVLLSFVRRQFSVSQDTTQLHVSFFMCLLGLLGLGALLRDRSKQSVQPGGKTLAAGLFGGYILYAASLLFCYLYVFYEGEALSIVDCSRYTFTYFIGGYLLLLAAVFGEPRQGNGVGAALLCALLCFGLPNAAESLRPIDQVGFREAFDVSDAWMDALDPDRDRVYFVSQRANGLDYYVARYDLTPVPVSDALYNPRDSVTLEDFEQTLYEQYTYLYVSDAPDTFAQRYGALFASPIQNGGLYRVKCLDGQRVRLELLENP